MFDKTQPNYLDLRNIIAERTAPIILWLGSGLSTAANLPSWMELKDLLVERFRREHETLGIEEYRKNRAILDGIEAEDNLWLSFQRLA